MYFAEKFTVIFQCIHCALWLVSITLLPLPRFVEHASAVNVKRTWVDWGRGRDWGAEQQGQGEEFLYHATQVKNVWLSMGDIFAN